MPEPTRATVREPPTGRRIPQIRAKVLASLNAALSDIEAHITTAEDALGELKQKRRQLELLIEDIEADVR